MLLDYLLKDTRELRVVSGDTFDVAITTLDGGEFSVRLDHFENSVRVLKDEIERREGTGIYQQQLFLNKRDAVAEDAKAEPLKNSDAIIGECSMMLYVKALEGLQWSKRGRYISIDDDDATKVTYTADAVDSEPCRVTANVVIKDGEKRFWAVEIAQDGDFYVGAFKAGVDHNYSSDQSDVFLVCVMDGCLYGADQLGETGPGLDTEPLKQGDILGVLVDLEQKEGRRGGAVRFFANGVEYGPGFTSGVAGPLLFGAELCSYGQTLTLVQPTQPFGSVPAESE
jgi:hypothetical protein